MILVHIFNEKMYGSEIHELKLHINQYKNIKNIEESNVSNYQVHIAYYLLYKSYNI